MTELVGILNLTPDSFSGDGIATLAGATERICSLIAEGAGVIDIGAESTRPHAALLTAGEEWQRLEPLLHHIAEHDYSVKWSLDTRHGQTVYRFLQTMPENRHHSLFINDISGGGNPEVAAITREARVKLIIMHALTLPADPNVTLPEDEDVLETVYAWAGDLLDTHGEYVIIDPGIGFGKTARQSWHLIKYISRLQSLGCPVLVGHSRKSFLSLFTDKPAAERDPETLIVSSYLMKQKVDYLRVHNVQIHAAALRIRQLLMS